MKPLKPSNRMGRLVYLDYGYIGQRRGGVLNYVAPLVGLRYSVSLTQTRGTWTITAHYGGWDVVAAEFTGLGRDEATQRMAEVSEWIFAQIKRCM